MWFFHKKKETKISPTPVSYTVDTWILNEGEQIIPNIHRVAGVTVGNNGELLLIYSRLNDGPEKDLQELVQRFNHSKKIYVHNLNNGRSFKLSYPNSNTERLILPCNIWVVPGYIIYENY
jgi:hypothetical protein